MANQLISPTFSLKKSLPSLNTVITAIIVIFLAWAFFSKESLRFYASFLLLFYSFTSSMWVSVVLLGVFQTLILIPFRIINLTKSKHIRDFEKKVNDIKESSEQSFLIKHTAREGNRIFLYYIIDFLAQLTSYVSMGRLFLTDFYSVKLPAEMLYSFVPYPKYPLQDTWFKIPYLKIIETQNYGFKTIVITWLIILVISLLTVAFIKFLKNQKGLTLTATPKPIKSIAGFITGSSFILMILSIFIIRNFPTQIAPAIFTGDISIPNRTFNTITAIATFITILWLDTSTILKKSELAKGAGINEAIIKKTQIQLFGETIRSAAFVGLGAYFITNLIPCAFELSIFTLEIISWLSPLTLDRLVLKGAPKYEAPMTLEIKDDHKSKIGLALGSGGWRGLAHIGVIKSLLKHRLPIDAVAGTSAGALIGGLYCLYQNIDKVENYFNKLNYKDLLFAFSDPSTKLGLFQGTKTLNLIQKYTKQATIESLPIPFAAVAADVFSGQPVVIKTGDLAQAIRASGSAPIVFEPVNLNGKMLIDGGAVNPIPVTTAKTLGADIVIGVDIYHSMFKQPIRRNHLSKIDLVNLTYNLILSKLAEHDNQNADLKITPEIKNLALDPFSRFINNQQTIDQGEIAMDEAIPKLKQLMASRP